MNTAFLLSITGCVQLLLTSSFLGSSAQSNFNPIEWTPQVSSSLQCGLTITPDLSDTVTTVAQLIKNTASSSSLPKTCMEIKESSPVSPSGYYTISNGTSGGAAIVYCNMDDLYSCPALEQTLKAIRDDIYSCPALEKTLNGFSNTLSSITNCEEIPTSCQEVLDKCPECTNGYYKILAADLTEKYVYCSFQEKCATTGPWTRVAFLNMSDSNSACPSGTQKFVDGSAIACGIQEPSNPKCVSITTSTTSSYSQICGQLAGYQKGSTDGFFPFTDDINGIYVDGVSITRGSPRQHLWTYAIGLQENLYHPNTNTPGRYICPCGATSVMQVPSFIGNDYYCESGCPGIYTHYTIYSDDVLWDGQQCGVLETDCCNTPGQPWFHKILDTPTSDNIELRMCINQPTSDENILVSLYDIYIK